MPEYLAPGVYVEETSFRAKSIEGVSTSTTGFVGPTRKGPLGTTPELITSVGDFERIYGSLDDLSFGRNYLAHGVRAYFNEGGARLYVSRAYLASEANQGRSSLDVNPGAADVDRVRFLARFAGAVGDGRIEVRETAAAATYRTMERALPGTLLRVGAAGAAQPARLTGGMAPFSVSDGGVLGLVIGDNGNESTPGITFRGAPAEVTASEALPDNVDPDANVTTIDVTIDGSVQRIQLPDQTMAREQFVLALNRRIRGGYFRLSDAGDGGDANRLIIGSDRRGTRSSVAVPQNAQLRFNAAAARSGADDAANNNVGDLSRVTPDEINALLAAANVPARASLSPEGRLVLATAASGHDKTLRVDPNVAGSMHVELGFGPETATGEDGGDVKLYLKTGNVWVHAEGEPPLPIAGQDPNAAPENGADFLTLTIQASDADGNTLIYEDMGFERTHPRWVGFVLKDPPGRRAEALENLFAIEIGDDVSGLDLHAALFNTGPGRVFTLNGGSDGAEPNEAAYEAALAQFEQLEDISIVAAPGSSAYGDAQAIQGQLIGHAERVGAYRIAVLDSFIDGKDDVKTVRSRIDSKEAALYHPWVIVSNPLARPGRENEPREIALPPSGFVCGVYARNDITRGVHKAPANEVVRGALRFETEINFAQQGDLNPRGINCLRFLPGRGYRVWGARTISSDPEWKYVNVTRYFNYIERSIDQGTQWAVFEPNGERLWANIRDTVSAFLYNEWVNGALLGSSQKEAFFVRCDRSTMTQNDLDNGRLICEVGIAVLKPAEFVIFRIGQKTADSRM